MFQDEKTMNLGEVPTPGRNAPLSERLRPSDWEGLVGQEHIWAPKRPLYELVTQDRFNAMIFWGPSGTGKTSLARLIGKKLNRPIFYVSAVHDGVKKIREGIDASVLRLENGQGALVMFVDEIHRLNKNQQDVLLHALEDGSVKFIGATSENPSFEVNKAILSRALAFEFKALKKSALLGLVYKAMELLNAEQQLSVSLSEDAADMLCEAVDGDVRRLFNLVEAIVTSADGNEIITVERLKDFAELLPSRYDKKGDQHYDVISAFIKSIRASHPDAALHYLARMLDGGEDPLFIARRLVIAASEEVGNANPTALLVATATMQATQMIGMPEARIMLAQTTTYLAASPKSNRAYVAIDKALEDVKKYSELEIPNHLRNTVNSFRKNLGYGERYAYPHDDLEAAKKLTYLPKKLAGSQYYTPKDIAAEAQLKKTLSFLRPGQD